MSIKREFLYNESKLIPIQLLKTNYGIADANPSQSIDGNEDIKKTVEIVFPYESSNIAMVLTNGGEQDSISEVRSAPPGTRSVKITIKEGISYSVYIVSKEYEDGFIARDLTVDANALSGEKFELLYETAPQRIDLSTNDAMSKSQGRDDLDMEQWYGYDGFYNGPLIWSAPSINGEMLTDHNYWIIVRQEILGQIDNIFRQNDLTSYNSGVKSQVVKMFKIIDDLIEFMQDKRFEYDELLGEDANKIEDIWLFINSNLPGFGVGEVNDDQYYITVQDKIGEWIDELGVYTDHMDWNRLDNGNYPDADRAGQSMTLHNLNASHPFTFSYNNQTLTYDLMELTSETRYQGQYAGGKEGRAIIAGRFEGIPFVAPVDGGNSWGSGHGNYDNRYHPAWNDFRRLKENWIREINGKLNVTYALPAHSFADISRTTTNREWWSEMGQAGQVLWDNISEWLATMIVENKNSITIAGNTAFSTDGQFGGFVIESEYTIMSPYTVDTTEILIDVIEQSDMSENDFRELLVSKLDNKTIKVKNELMFVDDIEIESITIGGTFNRRSIRRGRMVVQRGINNTTPESGIIGEPILVSVTTLDGFTNETPDGAYFPQAQEAILQNIRYLKDLVSSIDQNLWTAYNSTSSLVLASLIDIKNKMDSSPEKSTILNITNSTVRNSDVEVLWMKVGEEGWKILDSGIEDSGKSVKIINLNSESFVGIGKYMVLIRPKRLVGNVYSTNGDTLIVRDDLNDYTAPNYFYGYNAQLYTPKGYTQGEQKIIVASSWRASDQHIKLSPIIDESIEIGQDTKVEIWSNEFIPELIDVDVVEHNALTLSYSLYAKKEMNTDTGICVIYDHNGNEYKRLSFGKHSNAGTGNAIVEYRTPIDDTDQY